jgi:hypothetical protein
LPDDDRAAVMLRKVSHDRILQMADLMEDPMKYGLSVSRAVAISQGGPRTARTVLLHWLRGQIGELQLQPARAIEWRTLEAAYMALKAQSDGLARLQRTEMSLLGEMVAPDFGKIVKTYADLTTRGALKELFTEGSEIIFTGHNGTGKTHGVVLLGEEFLGYTKTGAFVINIPGTGPKEGQPPEPRLVFANRLSQVFATWARLPEEELMLLFLDEVEASLAAGAQNNEKNSFTVFRNLCRKMSIILGLIYHRQNEQLRTFREDAHERLVRVHKITKKNALVTRYKPRLDGDEVYEVRTEYQGLPDLSRLQYDHRLAANIIVDVNLKELLNRISDCTSLREVKSVVASSMNDPDVFLKDHQDEKAVEARDRAAQRASDAKAENLRQDILLNAELYVGAYGRFNRDAILARHPTMTDRKANYLAGELNKQLETDLAEIRLKLATYVDAKVGRVTAARLRSKGGYHEGYARLLEKHLQRKAKT